MTLAEKVTRAKADYDEVFEAGKKEKLRQMWETVQMGGARANYISAFRCWMNPEKTFYPIYDIKPVGSINQMFGEFARFEKDASGKVVSKLYFADGAFNLVERLNECNVVFDTSEVTEVPYAFIYCRISHFPVLDFRKVTNGGGIIQDCPCTISIEKVILKDEGQSIGSMLNRATGLREIRFEGKIIKGFAAVHSPFSADSAKNIIEHLENYAGTDEELAYSVSFHCDVWTRLNESGTPPSGDTWKQYVYSLGYNV